MCGMTTMLDKVPFLCYISNKSQGCSHAAKTKNGPSTLRGIQKMLKIISLALVCSVLLACSGSVTIMHEEEDLGTTTASSGTTPTQSPDGGGGSGDAGGDVVGGSGGEGGSVSDGGTSEGGSPPTDCDGQPLAVELSPITFKSKIVVGGSDWSDFSRYTVSNGTDKPLKIPTANVSQVSSDGDLADVTEVALGIKGAIFLFGSALSEDGTSFVLTQEMNGGLVIPANSSETVELWAKPAAVVSSATANGQWHGVARSGHTPMLALTGYRLECDAENVTRPVDTGLPNPMVLRKSKPIVEKLALPTNKLANADIDMFKFQVGADKAGTVAFRQIKMELTKTEGLEITDLKIRRGAVDINEASAWVFVPYGISFHATTSKPMYLVFKDEETISGSGNVYTIHGSVTGATAGQEITFSFAGESAPISFTGYSCFWLQFSFFVQLSEYSPDSGNFCSKSGNPPKETSVWSDISEVPHGLSSKDWTHGALLDLSGSETLSL